MFVIRRNEIIATKLNRYFAPDLYVFISTLLVWFCFIWPFRLLQFTILYQNIFLQNKTLTLIWECDLLWLLLWLAANVQCLYMDRHWYYRISSRCDQKTIGCCCHMGLLYRELPNYSAISEDMIRYIRTRKQFKWTCLWRLCLGVFLLGSILFLWQTVFISRTSWLFTLKFCIMLYYTKEHF